MSAHETPKRRGRAPVNLQGDRYGYLIPYASERREGVTWWKCHCLGKSEGALNCKQGEADVWVRHGNLVAGLHKSCGCMKYIREVRIGDLRLRKTEATFGDYVALGLPAPSWIPVPDERKRDSYEETDDETEARILAGIAKRNALLRGTD